ncbi:MAG: hypothetical protein Q9191_006320 [Dirinaria sp. TL-2023a]
MTQPSYPGQQHTEYNLPRNEPVEQARLEEQAKGLMQLMHGKIVHAPLDNPKKLLDVGCGTGIICRHLAQQYPSATIYGVDISPVPATSEKPENVEYIVGDIKQLADATDERVKDGDMDYIYQRLLICGMTDWPGYVRQMTKLLRSGGYMEIHDYAEIMYQCSSYPQDGDKIISTEEKWLRIKHRGAAQLGLDLHIGPHAEQYMKDAGLVDVQVTKYASPFGTWLAGQRPETEVIGEHNAKLLGKVFAETVLPGITRGLGVDKEEMRTLQEECRQSLAAGEGKYWVFYVTTGRKV